MRLLFHGTTDRYIEEILANGIRETSWWGTFRTASYFAYAQATLGSTYHPELPLYLIVKPLTELESSLQVDTALIKWPVGRLGMPEKPSISGEWRLVGEAMKEHPESAWPISLERLGSVYRVGPVLPVSRSEIITLRSVGRLEVIDSPKGYLGCLRQWSYRKELKPLWVCDHHHSSYSSADYCASVEMWHRYSRQKAVVEFARLHNIPKGEMFAEPPTYEEATSSWREKAKKTEDSLSL